MLSVAICTYNRAALLPRALESVAMQPAEAPLEILIIDNGSTDSTAQVVKEYQSKDERIRYIAEPQAGISYARNRALREARGEYLAFIDDDAWADECWLPNLTAAIQTIRPAPACVVGPVSLVWEGERPEWFPARFESLLCSYNMGDAGHFLSAGGYLLTTNVLFHRETLMRLGGLRTDLGHRRGALIGGEDNDIFKRLVANAYQVYYEPAARVFHPVPKERQTRRYLLRRLFWDGASQPMIDEQEQRTKSVGVWAELFTDVRRLGRFALKASSGAIRRERPTTEDAVYCLVQRIGRMRTHLLMAARVQ